MPELTQHANMQASKAVAPKATAVSKPVANLPGPHSSSTYTLDELFNGPSHARDSTSIPAATKGSTSSTAAQKGADKATAPEVPKATDKLPASTTVVPKVPTATSALPSGATSGASGALPSAKLPAVKSSEPQVSPELQALKDQVQQTLKTPVQVRSLAFPIFRIFIPNFAASLP